MAKGDPPSCPSWSDSVALYHARWDKTTGPLCGNSARAAGEQPSPATGKRLLNAGLQNPRNRFPSPQKDASKKLDITIAVTPARSSLLSL